MARSLVLLTVALFVACATSSHTKTSPKLNFDLSSLDADGLRGAGNGKRSLAYEFCIPDTPQHRREVTDIDPTVRFHSGSRGRIGCGEDQVLCIGETHQTGHREILRRLAELKYVKRIDECFFE